MKKLLFFSAVMLPFLFLIACKSPYVPLSKELMTQNNVSWKDLEYNKKTKKGIEVKLSKTIKLGQSNSLPGRVQGGGILSPSSKTDNIVLKKGKFGVLISVDSIEGQALVSYGGKGESLLIGISGDSLGTFLLVNSSKEPDSSFQVDYQGLKPLLEGQDANFLVRKDKGKKQKTIKSPTGRRWGQ